MVMVKIAGTLIAAAIGGCLARRFRIPAGWIVGSMIATAFYSIVTNHAYLPSWSRLILQIFAGASLGTGISRRDIRELKKTIVPTVVLLIGLIVMNFVMGGLMYWVGGLDIPTALFASTPGGVTDMALISQEMGADTVTVAILQLTRILFIFTVMPPFFRRAIRTEKQKKPISQTKEPTRTNQTDKPNGYKRWLYFLGTLVAAAAGGLFLTWLKISAGALIGSMAAVAVCSVFGKTYMPGRLRGAIQVVAGCFIGLQMNQETIVAIKALFVPVCLLCIGIFLFTAGVSRLMNRWTKLSLPTCMLACTPGGVQEMSLLAEELGVDMPKVTVMQSIRLMFVVTFFPIILSLFTKLYGI
ncbi:MAG: AbrB family transcriptional regulator [Lachnospiraceae bacterium]|nr:AbrB family transcriptional regulator [Lachnospiraceae bacterium]